MHLNWDSYRLHYFPEDFLTNVESVNTQYYVGPNIYFRKYEFDQGVNYTINVLVGLYNEGVRW
jgi:hypothetical protein